MDEALSLLAPRKVVKKRKMDHPSPSTAAPESNPPISEKIARDPVVVPSVPTDLPLTAQSDHILSSEEARDLLFEIEAVISDWGLSANSDLLERFTCSDDGIWSLHLSNLLQVPSIANLREQGASVTLNHLVQVIKDSESDLVKVWSVVDFQYSLKIRTGG